MIPSLHALFGPSSAEKITLCPASPSMCNGLPDNDSEDSTLGSCAHEIAARTLDHPTAHVGLFYAMKVMYALMPEGDPEGARRVMLGSDNGFLAVQRRAKAYREYLVTKEMVEYLQAYVDRCRSMADSIATPDCDYRVVEKRVDISPWTPIPDQFGTMDFGCIGGSTLHVNDLKYGLGIKVFAHRNKQLALYALGLLRHAENEMICGQVDKIVLTVSQPRLYHFDTWEITRAELEAFGEEIKAGFGRALEPDAPFNPHQEACRFCKAKPRCPGLWELAGRVIEGDFERLTGEIRPSEIDMTRELTPAGLDIDFITDAQLSRVVLAAPIVNAFAKAAKSAALKKWSDGDELPALKAVEGRSRREYLDEKQAARFLIEAGIGVVDLYEEKFITPAAAEKLLPKAKHAEFSKFIKRIPGSPTLVALDAPGKAATRATDVFDDLDELDAECGLDDLDAEDDGL